MRKLIRIVVAFFTGLREFRLSATARFCGSADCAYEHGRELAHRCTFRRFEP